MRPTRAALLLLAAALPSTFAAAIATPPTSGSMRIPIIKRGSPKTAASFYRKAEHMKAKYGDNAAKRRRERRSGSGTVSMTNFEDVEYYGKISVGTPSTSYNVILDTGSADLILAAPGCSECDADTVTYDPANSTSATTTTTAFSLTYGSGDASGVLVQDTVSIAGFSVSDQVFGSCDVMDNILEGEMSGLLGLGWTSIAQSGATPLLEALADGGSLTSELFTFAFKTYPDASDITSETIAGGTMTVGATDTSLFSGEINWIDVVTPEGYWAIPLQGVSVGGTDLGITSASVAIDTGTSLIGGPASAVEAVYAQLSGGAVVSGDQGYYSYDCSSSPNVTFTFGGVTYAIDADNFNSGTLDSSGQSCLGALFAIDSSQSVDWIFGDSFVVGYYSAFRFGPTASVGFATLGSGGTSSDSNTTLTSSSEASTGSTSSSSSTVGGRSLWTAAIVASLLGLAMV